METAAEKTGSGSLYLCAVPIGNDGDLSERCVQVLRSVGCIAAEHTDKSALFLKKLGIADKPLIPYSGRGREAQGKEILRFLQTGQDVALITDAGMPAVADPGEDLVRLCAEAGIAVRAVPGVCALVSALAVSALATGRFCFEGFLSTNHFQRKRHLDSLKSETRTMIFYEAPQKLPYTLRDLYAALGERRVTLCADLTRESEQITYTTLRTAAEQAEKLISFRSEYVLVIEGNSAAAPQ